MPRTPLERPAALHVPALLLLISIGAFACASMGAGSATETARVMVYNIHAGKDAAGADNLARVATLIRESGADIVLLQEVDRGTRRSGGVDQPAVLAEGTGLHAAFGKSLDYQDGEYGIAVLSRWPIAEHRTIPLPIDPPQQRAGGAYEPRVALRVTISSPSGTIEVINTHLDASGNDRWRRQEVVTVLATADSARLSASAGRAVRLMLVGGDMNSTPESAIQETVRARGLRDAWLTCGSGDSGFTFPATASIKRIDYLYFPASTGCTRAEVLTTEASDHRPLLVDVPLVSEKQPISR